MRKAKPTPVNEAWLALPIFGYDVCVNFSDNIHEERKKKANLLGGWETIDRYVTGLHAYEKDHGFPASSFIFLKHDTCVGIIVHEVSHAVDRLFKWIGEEEPGTETRAYLNQYLVMKILELQKSPVK